MTSFIQLYNICGVSKCFGIDVFHAILNVSVLLDLPFYFLPIWSAQYIYIFWKYKLQLRNEIYKRENESWIQIELSCWSRRYCNIYIKIFIYIYIHTYICVNLIDWLTLKASEGCYTCSREYLLYRSELYESVNWLTRSLYAFVLYFTLLRLSRIYANLL